MARSRALVAKTPVQAPSPQMAPNAVVRPKARSGTDDDSVRPMPR